MFQNAPNSKNKFPAKLFICLALTALLSVACGPSPSMMNNTVSPPSDRTQTENLTSLEQEIRDMKNAGFKYIYVFKRRDGGVFTGEDKQYIRANRPAEINRFSGTDDEKAFVAGSNFDFPPENMENLQKRFVIEIISKPEAPPPSVNNTNQMQNK